MAETLGKKEKQKRKQQKKKDKAQRKIERQSQAKSGSLEDMLAYVDEDGNLSSTPPDPSRKKSAIDEKNIIIGSRNIGGTQTDLTRKGRVTYFNTSKGYGFIKDSQTHESIFVHSNALATPVKENDFVSFHTERSVKGLNAIAVKKV